MEFKDVESSRQLYNDKITEIKDLKERTALYSQYKKAYKAYFVKYQLQTVFSDIEYDHNQGIDSFTLSRTGFIDTGDVYYSNDLVKGKYKNINFTQSDVEILKNSTDFYTEEADPVAVNTRSEIAFKGRFLIFELPKRIMGRVAILPLRTKAFFIDPIIKAGLKPIETESPLFNRSFRVYADDGLDAFYILDPAFIETVERFGNRYYQNTALYFVNNKILIAINDGDDSFEPPDPALRINEEKERTKVVEDMKLITDIVDSLDLS